MRVELLRKDSRGIVATYENAKHHAQPCLPLIEALEERVKKMGFKLWKQGSNIHVFETEDGRRFDFIPLYEEAIGYYGIEFRLRKSRSEAERLAQLTSVDDVDDFVTMVKMLSRPLAVNERGRFAHERQCNN
jgi:5-methylthioribose kinase